MFNYLYSSDKKCGNFQSGLGALKKLLEEFKRNWGKR